MVVRPDRQWRDWGRPDWNSALFLHFFFDSEGTSVPVRTLSVTPETLAIVTGDPDASPEDVKTSFLHAVGNDPSAIRRNLNPRKYIDNLGWLLDKPPPFFIYLILSCFVASGSDVRIRGEGNFRTRLNLLLGNVESVSNGLNQMWELFKTWLDFHRSKGSPYRDLELPDPGRMVLIGYSIRLGFPDRKDQNRLIDLLKVANIGDEPTPLEVIRVIDRRRASFGDPFIREFDSFRKGYFNRTPDAGKSPFWAAVRDAVCADLVTQKEDRPKFGLILFPSDSGFEDDIFLLSDRDLAFECSGKSVRFVRTDNDVGRLTHIAMTGDETGDDSSDIIGAVLDWSLFRSVPALKKSPLSKSVAQGILLFVKNDVGLFEWCASSIRDGSIKVFVREDLKDRFLGAFPESRMPIFHEGCRYAEWVDSEPFDAEDLFAMEIECGSELEEIRCLQSPIESPGLHLSGGIRVEDGYLGIPPCLPDVHAPEADRVEMIRMPDGPAYGDTTAVVLTGKETKGEFAITHTPGLFLEGQYSIIARNGEKVVGVKQINFRSKATPSEFRYPTAPSNWYIEAIGPDVRIYDPEPNGWLLPLTGSAPISEKYDHSIPSQLHLFKLPLYTPEAAYSSDAGSLIEICAGKFSRKRGIPEAEFLDLLQKLFPIEKKSYVWDLARSWEENSYFDRLIDRTWKARCYFAVPPHLLLRKSGHRHFAVLTGLATGEIRQFVAKSLEGSGATQEERFSHSPMVATPLMWSSDSAQPFTRIAGEIKIPIVECPDVVEHLWPIGSVIAKVSPPPTGYKRKGTWDWNRGYFVPEEPCRGEKSAVLVELLVRARNDAPDFYRVSWENDRVWWTYCRNWAFLVACTLHRIMPFLSSGKTDLLGIGSPWVHLPLVYARWLSATSHIIPSPSLSDAGQAVYVYKFPAERERDRLLKVLWGRSGSDPVNLPKPLKALISEARRFHRSEDRIQPLPEDLRDILNSLTTDPHARELAYSRFPARLIPGIRAMLDNLVTRRRDNE
jgi:hypothetical protein